MTVLGVVAEINESVVVLHLPNGLKADVNAANVSDVVTKQYRDALAKSSSKKKKKRSQGGDSTATDNSDDEEAFASDINDDDDDDDDDDDADDKTNIVRRASV
jgi:hypothetical protein